jgi:hypothetical protein
MAKKRPRACQMLARDIERLGGVTARLGEAFEKQQVGFGPPGKRLWVSIGCWKLEKFGPGQCAVYEIEREGSGLPRLGRKKTTVGNLYGLVRQLSRDIVKLWGCFPGPEKGFEGSRRR